MMISKFALAGLVRRIMVIACAGAFLSACAVLNRGGDEANRNEGDLPPQEERISVLSAEQELQANPRYIGQTIDLPPEYENISWAQLGGEADHTLHHLQGPEALKVAWRADIGLGSSKRSVVTAPPVSAGGKVFALDADSNVTAWSLDDGDRIWREDLSVKIRKPRKWYSMSRTRSSDLGFGGGLAVEEGRVYVTTGFGFVAALDVETGEEVWRTDLDTPIRTAPTAADGRVYAITTQNRLFALDTATGDVVWDFQAFEEAARILSASSPAVSDGLVVAPFSSGEVVALRANNGRVVWSDTISRNSRLTALSALNDIAGSPVIDRGLVYAVSHSGRTAAIDVRSGRRVWEKNAGGIHMPWAAGDYIFMLTVDSEVVCINRTDGEIVWVEELRQFKNQKKRKGRITWAGPVLASEALYLVSSNGDVLKMNARTGDTIAEDRLLRQGALLSPIIVGGTLIALDEKGRMTAFR